MEQNMENVNLNNGGDEESGSVVGTVVALAIFCAGCYQIGKWIGNGLGQAIGAGIDAACSRAERKRKEKEECEK